MRAIRQLAILFLVLPASLWADAVADARAHSDAFASAFNKHDEKAILALYAEDARVIWPGEGEEGKGKAAIQKMVQSLLKTFPDGGLTFISQDVAAVGGEYIATVGHWEQSVTGADGKVQKVQIRTSEVLRKKGKRTLYVVDHASIGLPPPPEPAK